MPIKQGIDGVIRTVHSVKQGIDGVVRDTVYGRCGRSSINRLFFAKAASIDHVEIPAGMVNSRWYVGEYNNGSSAVINPKWLGTDNMNTFSTYGARELISQNSSGGYSQLTVRTNSLKRVGLYVSNLNVVFKDGTTITWKPISNTMLPFILESFSVGASMSWSRNFNSAGLIVSMIVFKNQVQTSSMSSPDVWYGAGPFKSIGDYNTSYSYIQATGSYANGVTGSTSVRSPILTINGVSIPFYFTDN